VREAGHWPFPDRLPLQHDVDQEAADPECGVVDGEGVRRRGDEADAGGDLRRKRRDEAEDEQPEDQRRRWPIPSAR